MFEAWTEAAAPANPFKGAYLFGDWGGARLKMARKGVNFDVIFTQFGEGLTGSTKDAGFSYANKFDLFMNVDTAKASLWKDGGIGTHVEIRYGNAPTGANLFPANAALYTPSTGANRMVLTSLYFTQKVNDTTALKRPASYPDNGRALTDDVMDGFISILTKGKVTRDNVGPHNDLLTDFPYLGAPHNARSFGLVAA